jgi:DNA mismatch repair protein MutL
MGIIHRLDPTVANKIAAGEVVEKLANVVKELVENSIDAEANKIDIDLIESGMKLIRVIDNGLGMEESDALLAFERHATSKIKNVNDLFRIQSLGFRGEALPSIASISRVSLSTSKDNQAIEIIYEDGKLIKKSTAVLNQGTKIEVSRLFYSTPARFKYLKSPQYELSVIVNLINGFALANPSISFKLTNDNKVLFVSQGNDSVTNIIAQIYGINVAKSLIYFEASNRDYRIYGYLTNPVVNRSSRNYLNVVVNNRIIMNSDIISAISEAYEQLLPKHRYPVGVIYIEVDPLLIDVNIHPRKQEIKFSEKDKLLSLIKKAIMEKLEITNIYQKPKDDFAQTKLHFYDNENQNQEEKNSEVEMILEENNSAAKTDELPKQIPDLEYIGQFSGTYLLWQNETGLYLLDQHAAAERIRYERYLIRMSERNKEIQTLLTPIILELGNDILLVVKEHLADIEKLGLILEIQDNLLLARQIPNWFPKGFEEIYIEGIVDNFISGKNTSQESMIDDLAKLLACKHSLKANHYITKLEAEALVNDLRKCKRPFTCPHGRPIIVEISQKQIEYWFNRVI